MKKITLFFFLFSFFIPQLLAETINGDVKKISPEGKNFSIIRQDTKEEHEIFLSVETKFSGLSSLLELVAGDEVTVSGQQNTSSGHWEADSVTVSKMVIRHPQSDLAALDQGTAKSASVGSLENEVKIRTKREMKVFLEQFDSELHSIKEGLNASPEMKRKFKNLTKSVKSDKKTAYKKLKALEKSSDKNWPRAKSEADSAVQVLRDRLEFLKAEIVFNPRASEAAEVVIPSEVPAR